MKMNPTQLNGYNPLDPIQKRNENHQLETEQNGNLDKHSVEEEDLKVISHQNISAQKQQFQNQLTELNSALEEMDSSNKVYKIVGNIMVASEKPDLKKELEEKKDFLSLRIKSFEKQEKKLRENAEQLQKSVMENMKKNE